MPDTTIICPHCQREIPLTEALAKPLVEAARQRFAAEAREQEAALKKREADLAAAREALARQTAANAKAAEDLARARQEQEAAVSAQVAVKVKAAQETIAKEEARKAAEALAPQMQAVRAELDEKRQKLAEAEKKELEVRREAQRLIEERERFELDKQRAIDAERGKIREAALKDAAEQHRLTQAEKDKLISDLQAKLQDALRKAEQGSQQAQGEVQELDLESALRLAFPRDLIEPVPKGVHGGDVLHRVIGPLGSPLGSILWESKRTRNWSDTWLPKLRGDQREARADVAVLATTAMPKEVELFCCIDNVWVTAMRCAVPLAACLRQGIIEAATARQSADGKHTKMELVYSYLTGTEFRHRVQAIVEAFQTMSEDLEAEKRVITKQWAKRSAQIEAVLNSTVKMYGDLQGIAGQTMPQIEGLEFKALEAK